MCAVFVLMKFMIRTSVALVGVKIRVLGSAISRHVRRSNDLPWEDLVMY